MILIFFILGCIMASFGNVVISRGIKDESIIYPRSYCDNCGKTLKWFNLIPLISYILQFGKCNYCKEKISIKYSIFELVNGIIYMINCQKIDNLLVALIISLEMTLLMVMAIIDIKTLNIYNIQIFILAILANFYSFITEKLNFYKMIFTVILYFTLKIIENKKTIKKLGFGDIYVLLALFIQFNINDFAEFFIILGIISGIIASLLLISKKDIKAKIPFIPIITLSFMSFYFIEKF